MATTTKFMYLIRPPDIIVGGLRSADNYVRRLRSAIAYMYLVSSFSRQLPFELAERNSTKTSHVLGSECNLKMYVRNLAYTLL